MARLFLTYVALPPSDPHDDGALHAFAREVLVPIIALGNRRAAPR